MRKYFITAALIASFAAPAFAATTYYVAENAKTKKCSVTTKKPDGKTYLMVGTPDTYTKKSDATAAMKAAADCMPAPKTTTTTPPPKTTTPPKS